MFSNNDKERIVLEIGSGWTKVLIGTSNGKKKKKGLIHESIQIKDTFHIETPKLKPMEVAAQTELDKQFSPDFDKFQLIQELNEKLRQKKVKTEKVILTLGDRSVISREMVLPKVDEVKMKGIVSYELQEFLPIDPNQYLIDFKVVEELKVGEIEKYKLIVAALPKKEGQFYHELVQEMGKEPFALDISSNGISKLFDRSMKINGKLREIENKTFAYIDIGYTSIKLHIIENGILKFTRAIDGGIQPISNTNEVKFDTSDTSLEFVKKWIGSLEQMFKFYTSRETNRRIDHIFLYGGGALLPDIEKLFSEGIGVTSEVVSDIENIDLHKECTYFSLPIYLNSVASLIRR
ncbi:pilus assembly protein PilM [Proteiniclasticum sp.]|uniref:pilus assembly protein PilM n=1 Tax=Proteiniclasticum sp. TaxID=2053595 RepID=UPI00289E15DA|nr:pilus assembly protein PilM [Proteiniclasticum sp.]